MADMQWPSEDEDFDAITDAKAIKTFSAEPQPLTPTPAKKPVNKVAVAVSEPDAHQVQETEDDIDRAFAEPVEHRDDSMHYQEEPRQQAPQAATVPVEQYEEPAAQEAAPAAEEHAQEPYEHVAEPARAPKPPKSPRAPRNSSGVARTLFELVLVLALLGVGYYAYTLRQDKTDLKTQVSTLQANPQLAIQKQTDDLISTVGSLMTLPSNETPTVANVSDAVKARQQSNFFANAQNGDKVLMYVKAGQAILFRPTTSKIILVAPLTFNSDTAAGSTSKTTTPTTNTTR